MKAIAVPFLASLSLPVFAQGPLEPPPGVPAPGMKSLGEISSQITGVQSSADVIQGMVNRGTPIPAAATTYTITVGGTYYLTGNRSVPAGSASIQVNASDVTIDLNGFTISGAGTTSSGIRQGPGYRGLTVGNGTISNCGSAVGQTNTTNSLLTVRNIRAIDCGTATIYGGDGSLVVDCEIKGTSATYGIYLGDSSTVRNCRITLTSGTGIRAGANASLSDCRVDGSTGYGIQLTTGASLVRCQVTAPGGQGITAGNRTRMVDSSSVSGTAGGAITVGEHSIVSGCSSSGHSHNTSYRAFIIGRHSVVTHSSANSNLCTTTSYTQSSGVGFSISDNTLVENCLATGNTGAGFSLDGNHSTLRNNVATGNGAGSGVGSGIAVSGGSLSNRIEGNHLTNNNSGLYVYTAALGNVIVRNFVGKNSSINWSIVAGNHVAPIVSAATSGVVSGSTGGTALGSTDPNANFTLP